MKINVNLDFNRNQSLNHVMQTLSTAPASPVAGLEYYDTVLNSSYEYNGTSWISRNAAKLANGSIPLVVLATDPLARANHTGTQLAATISDLAATVRSYSLSGFALPTANIAMSGFTFTGLSTPTAAGHAAEYNWVLNQVQSAAAGIDSKPSVRLLAATNVPVLSGLLTIDSVVTAAGDRVLLTSQTTASQNGSYTVAAGAWSRTADTITPQSFWFVEEGTVYSATQWKTSTTGTITLGTTPLTIGQFGAANNYVAGNGLNLTGATFSVLLPSNSALSTSAAGLTVATPAGSGLTLTGTGIVVDTAVVARKFSTTIGDGLTTTFTITHNLNTLDILPVAARNIATGALELIDQVNNTVNTVTITFAVPPAANTYRITVVG